MLGLEMSEAQPAAATLKGSESCACSEITKDLQPAQENTPAPPGET